MTDYFLAKTEPSTFSIEDFVREQITTWDGVHNYQAINVIKTWKIGDIVYIYHSVKKPQIVGIARVITTPEPDLTDIRPSWISRLELIRALDESEYITLKEIKATGLFDDWYLIRQSRLSVMPVPKEFIEWASDRLIIDQKRRFV